MWEAYVLCLLGGLMAGSGANLLWNEGAKLQYIALAFVGLVLGWWGLSL